VAVKIAAVTLAELRGDRGREAMAMGGATRGWRGKKEG